MQQYTPTPDFYNDYIQHFNPFHDPRNGQFTTGRGGGSIYYSSLPRKVAAKNVAADNQDMFNDILYRNKYGKDKVEKKKAMKDFKKAVRELSNEFSVPNNIVEKYAKRGFEDRERYIEDSKKQAENNNKIAGSDFDGDGARVAKQKVKDLNKDIKKVYKVAGSDFDGDGARVAKQKIDNEVKRARKTGMYNMEFLERNLDLDPETETQLKGKALDDAYRKFLEDELKKNNK